MWRGLTIGWGALALALCGGGWARANDQPDYAPIEAWVKPIAIPKAAPAGPETGPSQTLLYDVQGKLGADGDSFFVDRVTKILTPEGMDAANTVSKIWDPDTEDLTIHYLHVIRGNQVIDVLAGGKKLLVLRRENKLELAMLDGRLTATYQPEGLQVGDIIDFCYTIRHHDPALKGFSEDLEALSHRGQAAEIYWRELWPADKPMRWRASDDLPAPTVSKTADGGEVIFDLRDVQTPKPPLGAPPRFSLLGVAQFSQFDDWPALSRLLDPLYEKATALAPGSPLRAEVAKIAAASNDPKARAAAALKLVEDETRYVFLGMDDGGLVPAAADDTWSRRFGDCKGKTALLVAILRALGVEAEPVIVSTQFGDGMDQRLPMAMWFDHAIVRAQIGAKTYWLDGTRVGDRSLDDLVTPNYYWALPIRPSGGDLIRLDPSPLASPDTEDFTTIDASKGPATPVPTHLEVIYHGEAAVRLRASMASAPQADYERNLREFWTKTYPWLDLATVAFQDDPEHNAAKLVGDGQGRLDWTLGGDGSRVFRVPFTALGSDVSFKREPGPHQDAPYAVNFPSYGTASRRITLPKDGEFVLVGADVDVTTAGVTLKRRSRIENGVLMIDSSTRAIEREFPAAEAPAAGEELRRLAHLDVAVAYKVRAATASPQPAIDPAKVLADAQRGDLAAERRLGLMYLRGQGVPFDAANAAGWLRKAADGGDDQAQAALGAVLLQGVTGVKDPDQAMALFAKAANHGNASAAAELGRLYLFGVGAPRDPDKALPWVNKAAAAGDKVGEYYLAIMYASGQGVPADPATAVEWARKAADQGLAPAMLFLAKAYGEGAGAPKDPAQAYAFAHKAADLGDATGAAIVGLAYEHGVGVRQDYALAMAWLREAGDRGLPNAYIEVGNLYLNGQGVTKSESSASDWYQKAFAKGGAKTALLLGAMYQNGAPGLTIDYAQARLWFGKAADAGDPVGENNLGALYAMGKGGPKDEVGGVALYRKAAVQGDPDGEANLGMALLAGRGVAASPGEAALWLQRAADAGNPRAALVVGRLYAIGVGVPRNVVTAQGYLRKAADKGVPGAQAMLASVSPGSPGLASAAPTAPPPVLSIAPVTASKTPPKN